MTPMPIFVSELLDFALQVYKNTELIKKGKATIVSCPGMQSKTMYSMRVNKKLITPTIVYKSGEVDVNIKLLKELSFVTAAHCILWAFVRPHCISNSEADELALQTIINKQKDFDKESFINEFSRLVKSADRIRNAVEYINQKLN
jgi:hypothetical protein